jgi:hypothetical protein
METTTTDNPAAQQVREGKEKKERAQGSFTLRFTDGASTISTEVKYGKVKVDPAFKPEGIEKKGPNGGPLRWVKGQAEWHVFEGETEISEDQIQYMQDGQAVEPFSRTQSVDVNMTRPMEECTLDGPISYGTRIPEEMVSLFGPDYDKGSKLYWLDGDPISLQQLLQKLEDKVLYLPFVFVKGLSIHLVIVRFVKRNGNLYLTMQTYAGEALMAHPVNQAVQQPEEQKPILAKPMLRKKKPASAVA